MQDPGPWPASALCPVGGVFVCVLPVWDAATVEGRIVGSRSGARPLGQGLSVPPSGAVPGGASPSLSVAPGAQSPCSPACSRRPCHEVLADRASGLARAIHPALRRMRCRRGGLMMPSGNVCVWTCEYKMAAQIGVPGREN